MRLNFLCSEVSFVILYLDRIELDTSCTDDINSTATWIKDILRLEAKFIDIKT